MLFLWGRNSPPLKGPQGSEGRRPGGPSVEISPNVKKVWTKLEIKQPFQARAGIDSLQFALPLMWTVGRQFGVTLDELHKLMSEGITVLSR